MNHLVDGAIRLGALSFCGTHKAWDTVQSPSGRWAHRWKEDGQDMWCPTTWATEAGGVK